MKLPFSARMGATDALWIAARRVAAVTLWAVVPALPCTAQPLIGYLAFGKPGTPTACADDLRRELATLGLREGSEYRFAIRHAHVRESGLHEAARELAAEQPTVLVSAGINPMLALRAASPGTPLVTMGSGGMIEEGLIRSFAQPGVPLTGISNGEREHSLKALELLLQAFSDPPRVGLVLSRANSQHTSSRAAWERLAASRKTALVTAWVDGAESIDAAYAQLRAGGVRHAVVMPDWIPTAREHATAALRHGIASIGFRPNYAAAGGLMNFSVRSLQPCQRAARYVERILAGRDPATLPVEQMDDYELVINLGTLRKLGVSLAPGFVARADRVIE